MKKKLVVEVELLGWKAFLNLWFRYESRINMKYLFREEPKYGIKQRN